MRAWKNAFQPLGPEWEKWRRESLGLNINQLIHGSNMNNIKLYGWNFLSDKEQIQLCMLGSWVKNKIMCDTLYPHK